MRLLLADADYDADDDRDRLSVMAMEMMLVSVMLMVMVVDMVMNMMVMLMLPMPAISASIIASALFESSRRHFHGSPLLRETELSCSHIWPVVCPWRDTLSETLLNGPERLLRPSLL